MQHAVEPVRITLREEGRVLGQVTYFLLSTLLGQCASHSEKRVVCWDRDLLRVEHAVEPVRITLREEGRVLGQATYLELSLLSSLCVSH